MALSSSCEVADPGADPFCERASRAFSLSRRILGGSFRFVSNSAALLDLVDAAYRGVPEHRLFPKSPEIHIELRLLPGRPMPGAIEPPQVRTQGGAGLICAIMDPSNYVVLAPPQRQGLVVASEDMLDNPYYLRYELIEFAVFVLAARVLGLVPLHGACVGRHGRGVLLLGASGAGKSTLALSGLLQGLDFLAEDAIFVQPQSLLATGIANFLHLKPDALRFIDDESARGWIAAAPLIRRRSGVQKFEADLRRGPGALAAEPLALSSVVFVSDQAGRASEALLSPIAPERLSARLRADQPYATGQPGWTHFEEQLIQRGGFELRRGGHPRAAVAALRELLE